MGWGSNNMCPVMHGCKDARLTLTLTGRKLFHCSVHTIKLILRGTVLTGWKTKWNHWYRWVAWVCKKWRACYVVCKGDLQRQLCQSHKCYV